MTDDAGALREQLESATGERISALEGIGEAAEKALDRDKDAGLVRGAMQNAPERTPDKSPDRGSEKTPEPKRIEHDLGL